MRCAASAAHAAQFFVIPICANAMHPLLSEALRGYRHHPDPDTARALEQARKILEDAPRLVERFASVLKQGKTLAACLDIDIQTLEDSYRCASKLVDGQMFQDALVLASFVVVIGPKNAKAAFKVASCLQHLGDVASAADYYKFALQIDPHHMGAAYRLGECLQMLDDEAAAAHLFAWTVELARGNFAHQKMQDVAESRIRKLTVLP